MKVAIYARYSSDNQRDASTTDQMRVCRAFAERQGWTIAQEYSDHAVSGAMLLRSPVGSVTHLALFTTQPARHEPLWVRPRPHCQSSVAGSPQRPRHADTFTQGRPVTVRCKPLSSAPPRRL
jgi:hypothetical protein